MDGPAVGLKALDRDPRFGVCVGNVRAAWPFCLSHAAQFFERAQVFIGGDPAPGLDLWAAAPEPEVERRPMPVLPGAASC